MRLPALPVIRTRCQTPYAYDEIAHSRLCRPPRGRTNFPLPSLTLTNDSSFGDLLLLSPGCPQLPEIQNTFVSFYRSLRLLSNYVISKRFDYFFVTLRRFFGLTSTTLTFLVSVEIKNPRRSVPRQPTLEHKRWGCVTCSLYNLPSTRMTILHLSYRVV